jgi:hypothetical protein
MLSSYGGHGVDIRLSNSRTTNQVFWSQRGNSYVIVADDDGPHVKDGQRVALLSINGMGQIRWRVSDTEIHSARRHEPQPDWDSFEFLAAFTHFGLETASVDPY